MEPMSELENRLPHLHTYIHTYIHTQEATSDNKRHLDSETHFFREKYQQRLSCLSIGFSKSRFEKRKKSPSSCSPHLHISHCCLRGTPIFA
jgi:hypothetical protein